MISRNLALSVLNSLEYDPGPPERLLERVIEQKPHLSQRDRAFAVHLIQGVSRFRLRFDWIIEQFARLSFRKIEPPVLNILRIALYQIFFMDRVPESAAVNEAVKQTKAVGKGHVSGFVNAILRKICRQKDQIRFPDPRREPLRYLSVYYSYPEWMVKKWIEELGIDSVERLLDAENQIPDLVVRTNSLKVDRSRLIGFLEEEGLTATPTLHSPEGIVIKGLKGSVSQLNTFKKGLFQVQSEAAQICSHLMGPGEGDSVLDLCAGLGGKSTHLAELMGGKGSVLSLDISHSRLIRLSETSIRLGLGCIHPVAADASVHLSSVLRGTFDKILVDGPCSGLGILSRHPDGKWSRDEADVKRLSRLQEGIISESVPLLKTGGAMLYVTCTISREENEDVVNGFLKKNSSMTLVNLKDHAPDWALEFIDDQGFFKTLPHVHGMDGFFAARFRKGSTIWEK